MAVTLETVQRMSPDQASLTAAGKLLKPAKWPMLGIDTEGSLAWGECQGSGSTPYRVQVALDDLGYKCSCPSRKFPCKHVLALLWTLADRTAGFAEGEAPDWVRDWIARRRPRATTAPRARAVDAAKDIAAALAPEAPVDPEAEAKKAAAAAKGAATRREAREAGIAAGLDDLDQWLRDVLGEGLGAFPTRASERCRLAAARLVDARAGGVATVLDELPSALYARPDAERVRFAGDALGRLALLAAAYRHQDELPEPLRAEVRRRIGWSMTREELLEDPATLRIDDCWTVLGVRSETQADRLVRHETWLRRHGSGSPSWALLMDFVPVVAGRTPPPFAAGEVWSAELAFYPSTFPLRAQIARRSDAPDDAVDVAALRVAAPGLDAAITSAQRAIAAQPFLDPVPVVVSGVRLGLLRDRPVLADAEALVPVTGVGDGRLLSAAGPITAAGLWSDGQLALLAASTAWGGWYAA